MENRPPANVHDVRDGRNLGKIIRRPRFRRSAWRRNPGALDCFFTLRRFSRHVTKPNVPQSTEFSVREVSYGRLCELPCSFSAPW